MRSNRINIILLDNQKGLSRDAEILAKVLRFGGYDVQLLFLNKRNIRKKIERLEWRASYWISGKLGLPPPYAVNIFLEKITPFFLAYARYNCFIPNQEWFSPEDTPFLSQMDCVLCKTQFAANIFKKIGCTVEFISFTSLDRYNNKYRQAYTDCFHLAGDWAEQRGTKRLIEIWKHHPEWPTLKIRHSRKPYHLPLDNVQYLTKRLEDNELLELQNTHGLYLGISESEGFGHHIVEAMSCRAIVVTTNAPPMNEIVNAERGILVDYSQSQPHSLGHNYYFDSDSLESQIDHLLGMSQSEKIKMGNVARNWFLNNNEFFKNRILDVINSLLKG